MAVNTPPVPPEAPPANTNGLAGELVAHRYHQVSPVQHKTTGNVATLLLSAGKLLRMWGQGWRTLMFLHPGPKTRAPTRSKNKLAAQCTVVTPLLVLLPL
jgi:hypothetical protein